MSLKVAINGFGRIGRITLRTLIKRQPNIEIVAINDLADPVTNAHLLKYDTNYGPFDGSVTMHTNSMLVNGRSISVFAERDWTSLKWDALGVDLVIECTGVGTNRHMATKHLTAGANKVLISAPSTEVDVMVVLGVNHDQYDPHNHHLISNASCTTNGLAPPLKVLHARYGIAKGQMTTVHSFTNTQSLLDLESQDLRDARAASSNIVPASTGAARAIGVIIPELSGRLDGASYRVPTPTVSIVEFVALLEQSTTAEDINATLRKEAQGSLKGILDVSDEPLVSMDLKSNEHSSIVDSGSTMVVDGNLAKVAAWYDNEWGYSCRLADMAAHILRGLTAAKPK